VKEGEEGKRATFDRTRTSAIERKKFFRDVGPSLYLTLSTFPPWACPPVETTRSKSPSVIYAFLAPSVLVRRNRTGGSRMRRFSTLRTRTMREWTAQEMQ
jgi:hypothetical protein